MKRPTLQEFIKAWREKEATEGTKMQLVEGSLPAAHPLTDEDLKKMWQNIQHEPETGVEYHGEITSLT